MDKAQAVTAQTSDEPRLPFAKKTNDTNKASQTMQTALTPLRNNLSDTLPRLPWQLERLLSAASSGVLPETVMLSSGLITDLNRYVLGWAASGKLTEHGRVQTNAPENSSLCFPK